MQETFRISSLQRQAVGQWLHMLGWGGGWGKDLGLGFPGGHVVKLTVG